MNRVIILLAICLTSHIARSQQTPLFTQYRENYSLINPAIINADRMAFDFTPNSKASLGYRRQWTRLNDSPRTMTGQYEHLFDDHNMGTGVYLTSDALGPVAMQGINLRYNYQAYFTEASYLSMGLAGGISQFTYRGSLGRFQHAGDNIGFIDYTRALLDWNLGLSLVTEVNGFDVLYSGLSVPQTFSSDFDVNNSNPFPNSPVKIEDFKLKRAPHLYFLLGYYKYLTEGLGGLGESVFLEPSIWVKYVKNAPVQTDMHLRFQVTNLLWIGGGVTTSMLDKFRTDNAHLEFGFNAQSQRFSVSERAMKIGFGYDTNISSFGGSYLGPAFEVNITYSWLR